MKIIKNQHILSQEYVPERVLIRNEEIARLRYLLFGNENSTTVVLKGNPGTGKTLISKHLLKEYVSYHPRYINCYLLQNEKNIISEIVGKPEIKAEILNSSIERDIRLMLSSFDNFNNFVILDEAHSLRRKDNSFLYSLSRSQELGGPPVKLLLVTIEDPEIFLDKSTLSGIGKFNRITLREYNSEQLLTIIKDRAQAALYEGTYDEEALETVSELSEETGSARIAIELLSNSILMAENLGSYLTSDIVLETFREFSPPIDESSLTSLDPEDLKILENIIELSRESRFMVADVRNAMSESRDSRVYRFLYRLENIGIIKKIKMSKGYRKGVQNEYLLKVPPQILLQKIKMIQGGRI